MAQPFTATHRISFPYIVSGLTHFIRHFCISDESQSGGIYNITDRDSNALLWTDAVDAMGDHIFNVVPTGSTYGSAVLEKKSGPSWVPLQTYFPTLTPSTHAISLASEITFSLIDTAFNRIKVVMLDTTMVPPLHNVGEPPSGTDMHNMAIGYDGSHGTAGDPFAWVVSRSEHYIDPAPWRGTTVTLNRRVRRARGLA